MGIVSLATQAAPKGEQWLQNYTILYFSFCFLFFTDSVFILPLDVPALEFGIVLGILLRQGLDNLASYLDSWCIFFNIAVNDCDAFFFYFL